MSQKKSKPETLQTGEQYTGAALSGELVYFAYNMGPDLTDITLVGISDIHRGAQLFSEWHFRETIDFIRRTPNAYAFLNGDYAEAALRGSKGDIFSQVGTPQDQRDWVLEALYPIRNRILFADIGNHDDRIYQVTGMDIAADISKALNIPYRPEGGLLKISFGTGNSGFKNQPYSFWIYATHGYGGARTKSAKAIKAERLSYYVHADAYFMSHDHVSNASPNVYLQPAPTTHKPSHVWRNEDGSPKPTSWTEGNVIAHRKIEFKTNAYLKWGGYAERGGFPPVDLETPICFLLTPESDKWSLFPGKPRKMVKALI